MQLIIESIVSPDCTPPAKSVDHYPSPRSRPIRNDRPSFSGLAIPRWWGSRRTSPVLHYVFLVDLDAIQAPGIAMAPLYTLCYITSMMLVFNGLDHE